MQKELRTYQVKIDASGKEMNGYFCNRIVVARGVVEALEKVNPLLEEFMKREPRTIFYVSSCEAQDIIDIR